MTPRQDSRRTASSPRNRAAGEMRIATCSSRAQADRELVRRAVRQTVQTWKEVVAGRKAGRELVLATVPQVECASQHAVTELMADRVLVRLAVRQYGHALHDVAAGLTADRKSVARLGVACSVFVLAWVCVEVNPL
jgi:hypothetical protein